LRNATASALITRTDTPQSFGKARMLVPELTRQYDEAFQQFDVLVMPTMPFVATTLTAADAPIEEYVHSALNMLANTA
ncbi:amidase, partial [Pseudomonas syringae pv. japonica str. M301072]